MKIVIMVQFLEADVEYPVLTKIKHEDIAFLAEGKKINKVTKLITFLVDKKRYVIDIEDLKQALNHGLKLRKVHRAIKFRHTA